MARRVGSVFEKRYWREAEARAVVTAWQRSGESLSSFARAQGVKARRIAWWAARLGVRTSESVRFHPVHLIEPRVDSGPGIGAGQRLVQSGGLKWAGAAVECWRREAAPSYLEWAARVLPLRVAR